MNKDYLIDDLCEKIKDIEKEVSSNYIGKLKNDELKAYQKDVVGRINALLKECFNNDGE